MRRERKLAGDALASANPLIKARCCVRHADNPNFLQMGVRARRFHILATALGPDQEDPKSLSLRRRKTQANHVRVEVRVCKVLVVDDEEDVFELARVHLTPIGHEIHSASNGEEALQFLADHESDPPCVLLTDLRMPVLDGWDLLYALKVDPRWVDLPVIVCSASVLPGAAPPVLKAKAYWSRRPSMQQLERIDEHCVRHHRSGASSGVSGAPVPKAAG